MAGSGAKYVFDFISNHQNVLPSDLASLHFYQPCINPPIPSHFSQIRYYRFLATENVMESPCNFSLHFPND